MGKLVAGFLFLLSGIAAFGQGTTFPVLNRNGQPMGGASVAVCTGSNPGTSPTPCSSLANTFTDQTLATPCTQNATTLALLYGSGCTNPGLTDPNGNAISFTSPGGYWAQIYGYQITTAVFPFTTGSANFSFSSPPPIGNIAPNTGNFTSMSASSYNNVCEADRQTGSDTAAKINACVAYLPSGGGIIDATSIQGTAVSSTTIVLSKPVWLRLGAAFLKLPGIQITANGVRISGISQQTAANFSGSSATTIQSNAANPLIWSVSGNAYIVEDVNLDGNSQQGLMGVFDPYGSNGTIRNVKANNFLNNGFFLRGGLNKIHDSIAYNNGGDGFVLGSDSEMDGYNEFNGNGGCGLHIHAGGTRILYAMSDMNTGCGAWIDGSLDPDWQANHAYVAGSEILPAASNAGHYIMIQTSAACTSGGSEPVWSQTPGNNNTDGSCSWVTTADLQFPGFGTAIVNLNSSYNGSWGLLVQGDSTGYNSDVMLDQIWVNSAGNQSTSASGGIKLQYVTHSIINSLVYYGSAANQKNDPGGIAFAPATNIIVNSVNSLLSHKSAVQLDANSGYSDISNVNINQNGDNTTAGNDLYGIELNASTAVQLSNVQIQDTRGTNYSKGIDASSAFSPAITNYHPVGTSVTDAFGAAPFLRFDASAGGWDIGGTMTTFSSGINITNSGVFKIAGVTTIDASRNATLAATTATSLAINGGATISNSNAVPQVATPTAGQAACIKSAGPPITIGYCSGIVSSGGACSCN